MPTLPEGMPPGINSRIQAWCGTRATIVLLAGVCLLTATMAAAGDSPGVPASPVTYTEKVAQMPDLCQTDQAFRSLPHGGRFSCGPTAFANVLIAMDGRGFENLVAGDAGSKDGQRSLLLKLGAKPYLETARNGIGPLAAMKGIQRFVRERGYETEVEWQGWRRGGKFSTSRFVDPVWLRQGVTGDSCVVVNVGWYHYDQGEDLYIRFGGHYMTLAGYRREGDRCLYLIQDPAPRSGPGKVTHEARLEPIRTGRLAPGKGSGPRNAAGYFLIEGIVLKRTADAAILDGAIRLAIRKPK